MYNLKVNGQINADDIKLKVQKEPITNPPEYVEKELALKDDLINPSVIEEYVYANDVVMFSNYNANLRNVNWKSSCYGNNKFVAVGVKSSTATHNCFTCELPLLTNQNVINITGDDYYGVCYGNNKFVAVGNSNIAYSTDGITWNTKSVGNIQWMSVCYGHELFIAVGNSNIAYSTDGITWNTKSVGNIQWMSVCYGNNKFIAVGNSNIAYSTDGITWNTKSVGNFNWSGVCFGNGLFVAVANNSTKSMVSSDGITWNENDISNVSDNWISVCFGGNKFLACAENSKQLAFSTNGINWNIIFGPPEIYPTISTGGADTICYGNNTFIGLKSPYLIYSNIQYKKKLIYTEKMNEIATLIGGFFYPIGSCYRNFYYVNPSEELGFGEWMPVSDSVSMNTGYINNSNDPNFIWMRIK